MVRDHVYLGHRNTDHLKYDSMGAQVPSNGVTIHSLVPYTVSLQPHSPLPSSLHNTVPLLLSQATLCTCAWK